METNPEPQAAAAITRVAPGLTQAFAEVGQALQECGRVTAKEFSTIAWWWQWRSGQRRRAGRAARR